MQVGMDLGWLLDRFVVNFDPNWKAIWGQVGTISEKRSSKRMSKNILKQEARERTDRSRKAWGGPLTTTNNPVREQHMGILIFYFVPQGHCKHFLCSNSYICFFCFGHIHTYIYIYICIYRGFSVAFFFGSNAIKYRQKAFMLVCFLDWI